MEKRELLDLPPEELGNLISDYLLCSIISPMAAVAGKVCQALRFGLSVELTGEDGTAYSRVTTLLKKLEIPVAEVEYTKRISLRSESLEAQLDKYRSQKRSNGISGLMGRMSPLESS